MGWTGRKRKEIPSKKSGGNSGPSQEQSDLALGFQRKQHDVPLPGMGLCSVMPSLCSVMPSLSCFCFFFFFFVVLLLLLLLLLLLGHTPSTAGTFRKKFRKNSGKTPETLSERFLEFLSRVRLGCPKPYNSRHLRLPERFQNSLPPSTAGDASFFRIGSGEGLSELVMEFPAVLGVFLIFVCVLILGLSPLLRHALVCSKNILCTFSMAWWVGLGNEIFGLEGSPWQKTPSL